jgi:TrmH family RNA methyltransferase
VISSPNNPTIRRIRRLRKRAEREKRREFIVEGHRAVRVALDVRHAVHTILHLPAGATRHRQLLIDARDTGARLVEVAPDVMRVLTSAANPPDLAAVAELPRGEGPPGGPTLVLHAVRDPATVGSLLASAAAAGVARAVAVSGTADLFASTPVRVAAGAHFVLGLAEAPTVAASIAGMRPVVVLGDDGPPPWRVDLGGAPAMVVGEPPEGGYDAIVCVPSGAAIAPLAARGAVVMFEARRQREST